jgi:hypothetical protein
VWQLQKATIAAATRPSFVIRGGKVLFAPDPSAGDAVFFEYVSQNWCQSSMGSGQSAFAADTDAAQLSEELLTMGLVWRFLKAKGLDYAEPFRQYEAHLSLRAGADGAKPTLAISRHRYSGLTPGNVSDGNWPS